MTGLSRHLAVVLLVVLMRALGLLSQRGQTNIDKTGTSLTY